MITAKILISIALVFIALSLASAMTLGRRRRHPSAKLPYSRAELEAMTARAEARRWADPLGLRRPLFFRSVRLPSGTAADGGDQVHPGFPAVRYFSMIREDRRDV
ncbi:hypothetical protein J4G43_030340 [Bradyrhizobium barranii subsp. barranii]|uniref:Uncharacterized protein n=1 Tax=Bradyrhizobium barranii subsp. barranii TaxID=2823807 RepID=A0A939S0V5_9BRAD|nr:hypothetical protein [Bradyrhizobium barranii]UEM09040.1 hypothetical protein J4G43_030340 [Bradyrhizobium barranii subsp. barranii]